MNFPFSIAQKISEEDSIVWLKEKEFHELNYSDNDKLISIINNYFFKLKKELEINLTLL
jgi:hypothetical protein